MSGEQVRTRFWKKTFGSLVVWYSKWDNGDAYFTIEVPHAHITFTTSGWKKYE